MGKKRKTKVTILGSGTCVPRLDRSACAVLVETGNAKILLDLGPGTMHRLLTCGITIFDLTHIFLSHFHPDHTAELAPLIFATKYPNKQARKSQLVVMGGTGLASFYKGLQGAYGEWIVLPAQQLSLLELDGPSGPFMKFDDFSMRVGPVVHRPESLAIRIVGRDGISVAYSGDTDECDSLVDLAQGVDLFICESAMPDEAKAPGHLSPSVAGRIAHKAQVKRLVLTHLYPPCDEVDIVKQARTAYKGPIDMAEDLMSFHFYS